MGLQGLTPMLRTSGLRETVEFYERVLGFRCEALREDWGWASLRRDAVEIMVALPNAHESFERPAFTGSLYIRTDDVDSLWLQVKDSARVCYPLEDFAYGMREFAIYDNNGYLLQFGREVPGSQ